MKNRSIYSIIAFLAFITLSFTGFGQKSDTAWSNYYSTHPKPSANSIDPNAETASNTNGSWIQDRLCIALLIFAFLLCSGEMFLFLKGKIDQAQILKILILTLIVFSILFLITAGYDNAQTQTSVGLLGTIAGYLLGRTVPDNVQTPVTSDNKSN